MRYYGLRIMFYSQFYYFKINMYVTEWEGYIYKMQSFV